MKFVLYGVGAIGSFILSLIAALLLTGNLSGEALSQLMGRTEEEVVEEKVTVDPLRPLAQELRKKEEALKQREKEIQEHAAQLDQRESELQDLLKRSEELQKQLYTSLDDAEVERKLSIKTVALTVEAMKPTNAAKRLENMLPSEVAEILVQVKDKSRGKIVEEMDTEFATQILRELQDIKAAS